MWWPLQKLFQPFILTFPRGTSIFVNILGFYWAVINYQIDYDEI